MAINLLVVGFSTVPVKDAFYDYLAFVDRYEFAEIHGKIRELVYKGETFNALLLTIDVMVALNDTNLYEVFLLTEAEKEFMARNEELRQFNRRLKHWLKGTFTHVIHGQQHTYACMEKINVDRLNQAIKDQHLPLDASHDKAPDDDEEESAV